MMSKGNSVSGMNGMSMNGMGDMFVYPQGASPDDFYQQQLRTGAMPTPGQAVPLVVNGEQMEETSLYDRTTGYGQNSGSMSWEAGPAPWEQTALPNHMQGPLYPNDAPAKIAQLDAKTLQAAQAAKIAADNAVRAARVGAPQVAATNAATAQAAASVAAQSAVTPNGQKAAAVAANEATKAVAAANVAAKNGNGNGAGMGDWMTLSGLGATSLLEETFLGFKVKHIAMLGAVTAGVVWGLPWLKQKFGK